jgi:5-methylcytosine-specific restriction protein A
MSLHSTLGLFLDEYSTAIQQPFAANSVAEFIRRDIPEAIEEVIGPNRERYLVHGSAVQGNWAKVPWVAVFGQLITETAQDGYYVVYLFKEDSAGVYLSLNQGVTTAKNVYGAGAKEALRARAADFLARLGVLPDSSVLGAIDLDSKNSTSLGAYYEQGSICAKYYAKDTIPEDEELRADLNKFIELYFLLASKELVPYAENLEEDEKSLNEEDLRTLREHKRIERNRRLAEKAKKVHGYTCQACNFNFEEKYEELGKRFIEAYHLIPLHELKGQKVILNPKVDFAILCSNCHRMIHRTTLVSKANEFKAEYVVSAAPGLGESSK